MVLSPVKGFYYISKHLFHDNALINCDSNMVLIINHIKYVFGIYTLKELYVHDD